MDAFFALLRERVGTTRVFAAARRDYELFRALHHVGCGPRRR
jgi:integrase/recombinase XerD